MRIAGFLPFGKPARDAKPEARPKRPSALAQFGRDLNRLAKDGKPAPVIGRKPEMLKIAQSHWSDDHLGIPDSYRKGRRARTPIQARIDEHIMSAINKHLRPELVERLISKPPVEAILNGSVKSGEPVLVALENEAVAFRSPHAAGA